MCGQKKPDVWGEHLVKTIRSNYFQLVKVGTNYVCI